MRATRLLVPLLGFALVGGFITVGETVAPAPSAVAAGTPLYPNLKTLPPRDVRFDRTDTSADGSGVLENVLRFSNTVLNTGEGALSVYSKIDPTTKSGTAYQRVFDTGGGYTDFNVGSMDFHDVHNHYHYDNWGSYQLWAKADYDGWVSSGRGAPPPGAIKKVGTKTTSCIVDEEFQATYSNTPYPGVYPWTGCMPDSTGVLREGLSPGWGDTYDYYRYEQWFNLGQGTLPDGDYVIRSVSDPTNKVYESANKNDSSREGERDNEAITPIRITGGKLVDLANPTGTITLNRVDATTASPTVSVAAYGRDDVSGVDTFQLSNNGTTWSSPFTFSSSDSTPVTVSWSLTGTATGGTAATGTKTVYARFHDRAGRYSTAIVTDSINYTGTASAPAPTDAYGKAVVADGATGYWRLGETTGTTALNSVSGGTAGAYLNGVSQGQTSLVPSVSDKSAKFDGSNDSISIPFNPGVDASTAVSVEAWIRPTALPAAGQWATVTTKPESFSLQFYGDQIEFTIMQNGVRQRARAASGTITAGKTYHLVGTYDGQNEKLYVNGKLVPMRALTGAITQNPNGFNIGSWDGTSEYFNGSIDEVAVYKTGLSASQVSAHYTTGTTSTGTADTTAPSAPGSLTATATSASRINLSWTASTDNVGVSGYKIFRNGSGSPLTTVGASTLSYADTTASPSTTYTYQVTAFDAAGNESTQASASATTPAETTTPPPSGYAAAVLSDGATGYWRLGEASGTTAANAVSGGSAGTYKNSPTLGQPSLLPGDAANTSVRFNGTSQSVAIPFNAGVDASTAVTVEAWIKPNALPATGRWASVATKPESFTLQFSGDQLEFTIIQNGVRQRMRAPSGTIVAGQVYHVIGTYDGKQSKLYVNGKLVPARTLTGAISQNPQGFNIGSWDGASEFFNGWIDDVAVYKSALTQTQVNNHYALGRP
jgi:hypothetical protein